VGENARVKFVLRNLDAGMQRSGGIPSQDWHLALSQDFAGIHPSIDKVNRATGGGNSGFQRLFPSF
jgi:hypothetical protein